MTNTVVWEPLHLRKAKFQLPPAILLSHPSSFPGPPGCLIRVLMLLTGHAVTCQGVMHSSPCRHQLLNKLCSGP